MRHSRLLIPFVLASVALGLCLIAMAEPSQAAVPPGSAIIPLGAAQSDPRSAYVAALAHLYGGGRVHRAADPFGDGTLNLFAHGDLIIPDGDLHGDYTAVTVSNTLPLSRAYALRPGAIALLRSTVVVTEGQNRYVAMWELANARQFLDGYLMNTLPYTVLDEAQVAGGNLSGVDLLIIPAIRPDAVLSVTAALSDSGALAAIQDFVLSGGALYAQSNGAYVAEAAGLLPEGTVDLNATIELDPGAEPNTGQMQIQMPGSPLAWSWLTNTLYILTDPLLHPGEGMEVIASLTNAGDAPAILRADAGQGQVIIVAGHPTAESRRVEAPIFMDGLLLALSDRAELTGDAIQTWNPHYDPHEFPAYEVVPVSVTLLASNLWDVPLHNVIVTETVAQGYTVLTATIIPTPTAVYTIAGPTTCTLIIWNLDTLTAGQEIQLRYVARSDPDALAAGVSAFSTGEMGYTQDGKRRSVAHRPFVLTAQMAARLVGDRDLEADRHYRLPSEGIYLDVALPLENKEWTLAHNVIVTDWVYLIHPIVDIENQHVILNANDGETIWIRNEPFLWDNENYPLPVGETSPTRTYTLADWRGDWCVFTSTYGIHTDPPTNTLRATTEDYGSFITIPPTYTDYISVTADHRLLLPCLPLTFDLGDWPGYWYEEPAVRYGVHPRELLGREVRFHGTPREGVVVMPYDAGSVYVAAGSDPAPFREYLGAAVPYAAAALSTPGLTYQDVWSRTHFTPFRATFYDTWDWDSCATCDGMGERHAALNLTFGLVADLDGDGIPETPVREIPTRLPQTWLTLMGKTYNAGQAIPSGMNLIDLPIFHGLGVIIHPESGDWDTSWRSPLGHTTLVSVTETAAYDHLLFQQNVPPGVAEVFYVDGLIRTYNFNREGMFKLHDGARLVYRQMAAGPNRYEVYDSHVHSVIGLSSDGRVAGWVGPTAVSVYGDSIYYLYTLDDPYDPRTFTQDPYMNSWGYGDFVATVYVGGREQKTLFRSIVAPGDRTRARISLDNNTGLTLTQVSVVVETPAWLTATLLYTDPRTAPEPLWPELSFLNVDEIPDAGRGIYYFDLSLGDVPTALLGAVITLPVQIDADGLPAEYDAPPLVLALRGNGGSAPPITLGAAHDLVLTETLPANVTLQEAALVDAGQRAALANATDYDALHPLSDTAAALFATFAPTLPFTVEDGSAAFVLPEAWRTLPADEPRYVAARATITRANHGPNRVGDGGDICYRDPFNMRWCDQGEPLIVEAGGAVVSVDYFCAGDGESVLDDAAGHCTIPPDETGQLRLRVTAYNQGDALARTVTATLQLPAGVTPVNAPESLTFGDIAPGGWQAIEITLQVAPAEGEIETGPSGWQFPLVSRTWGQFFDTASQRTIAGQFGDEFAVGVLWKPRLVYLPTLLRNLDGRPDLLVTAIAPGSDDPNGLRVTIANAGHSAARNFWVDIYLDPSAPPEVNRPWPDLSLYGAAWFVDELTPGASLTLTIGDAYYQAQDSRWPSETYPAGEHAIWAYADSWGHPQPYGSVDESDETNNRYGPVPLIGSSAATAASGATRPELPRPLRPKGE